MSSNRGDPMLRSLLAIALAASLAACASGPKPGATVSAEPLTPTQRYTIAVTHAPEQILLAPHETGLSAPQRAALDDLVARWRDAGAEALRIQAPTGGGPSSYRTAAAVQAYLTAAGVTPAQVELGGYDVAPGQPVAIVVSFERYHAEGPKCGRDWKDFTATNDNDVNPNFGCANTANLAAMIANPEDLAHPQAETPPDADRRETVLAKYRSGDKTSGAKDDQANGAVSTAVN